MAKLIEILKKDYMQTVLLVIVTIAIVVLFWYSLGAFFGTEHPFLAVASGSMEPVLFKGDLILIQGVQNACNIHADFKDANSPGDIIVFRKPINPSELVVHRAVEMTTENDRCYIRTQGDANSVSFGWEQRLGDGDIIGKFTGFKAPLLGHIALFFEPFEVKIAFILLWIILLLILEFIPLFRRKEEKEIQSNPSGAA